ncbi:MAG TPA: hypothetical protein VFB17_04290 [Gaiellaceae bacterium]|nr:hypothetical protein [Gaiellaceae bacterium]
MALVRGPRPEDVIGEWGVRDVTPPSQRERARVAADRELNPLVGKALPRRLRNFRVEADNYLASMGGPLPYMRRLRQIEDEIERHIARLSAAYTETEPARWRERAERWNFSEVNDLIERHNRWYPIEARLPMNPRTRDFVTVGGRDYRRRPLDAEWILGLFPAVS